MALIKCPKCGKEISDKATKCVRCGWKVDLRIVNAKEKVVPDTTFKNNVFDVEDERKRMLKAAEVEIEKMKEAARQEVESMNESAKVRVAQEQEEIALEKKSLERERKELEQAKEEQGSGLQHISVTEKKTTFPNVNVLFVLIPIVIMICFMVIVWRRLNNFSAEIEYIASNSQSESEILVNETESMSDEELDVIGAKNTPDESYNEESIPDAINIVEDNVTEQDAKEEIDTDDNVEAITKEGNDSRIEVTYDTCKTSRYAELVFTIRNVSDENMIVLVNSYQYINDVAIQNFGTIDYNPEIPAGKATVVNYTFDSEDVSSAVINKIEFGCRSSNGTEAETESSFIFDNLDINIK